jgi:integrase
MASIHRTSASPNWLCFYYDRTGKRRCKSTQTTDRAEAKRICAEIQKLEDRARSGRLTADKARAVIRDVVAEIMEASGAPLERRTIQTHFQDWRRSFELESKPGTFLRYGAVVDQFLEFLGPKAGLDLATLGKDEIEGYRNALHGRVAPGTVNTHLKVLRVALEPAVESNFFTVNPARQVSNVEKSDRLERRAFTLPELRKILAIASGDWKTAILVGVYTGLRLGDIQGLTWANLDLAGQILTVTTQKTGRTQILPIAAPLLAHLETLPVGDDPKAAVCPGFEGRTVSWLSNDFFELLAQAGLVDSRAAHTKKKAGRKSRRNMSPVSFHSLRHTATSLLKNAGVSDVVARDIIGHESEAVSRNYTHVDEATKRAAVSKLPNILQ